MVVIRLSRGGAKKAPFYHIVAADKRDARDGRFIERLGYFNPEARGKENRLELNKERIEYWIGKGAQPSERVSHLVKAFNKDAVAAAKAAPTVAETKRAQQAVSAASAKKKMDVEKKEAAEAEAKTAKEEAAAKAEEAKAEEAPKEEAKPEAKAEEAPKEEAKPEAKAEEAPKEEAKPEAKAEAAPKEEAKPEAKAEEAPKEEAKPEEAKKE